MTSGHVLVVSDDRELIEPLVQRLGRAGYAVRRARTVADALALVRQESFDLVVVDTDRGGLQLCRALHVRPAAERPGVVVIGDRDGGAEAEALELGADDYLARPVSLDVLMARVRARLRAQNGRTRADEESLPSTRLVFGALVIDGPRHEVSIDGEPVPFTATEFRLLHFLASSPGRVFTRAHLLGSVVGDHTGVIDRNVDVHVAVIRKKLGPHRRLLETVRGVGYRFQRVSRV